MPKSVSLPGIFFPTQKAANQHFSAMLGKYVPGDSVSEVDGDILHELIKRHPNKREKFGIDCSISQFLVVEHPEYRNTKCFAAMLKNGCVETFSLASCITGREQAPSKRDVK